MAVDDSVTLCLSGGAGAGRQRRGAGAAAHRAGAAARGERQGAGRVGETAASDADVTGGAVRQGQDHQGAAGVSGLRSAPGQGQGGERPGSGVPLECGGVEVVGSTKKALKLLGEMRHIWAERAVASFRDLYWTVNPNPAQKLDS